MGLVIIPLSQTSGKILGELYAKARSCCDLFAARAEVSSDSSRGACGMALSWTSSSPSLPGTCPSPSLPIRLRPTPHGPSAIFPWTSRTSFPPTAWPYCGSTALCQMMRVTPESGPKEAGRCGSCPSWITNANHCESQKSLRTGMETCNSTAG